MHFLMGRQAILDKKGKTFGYELLYREQTKKCIGYECRRKYIHKQDDSKCIYEFGYKNSKNRQGFINFTKDLIVERIYEALPREKIIVEVLEDVMAEPEVVKSIAHAKKLGYTIALDDFIF